MKIEVKKHENGDVQLSLQTVKQTEPTTIVMGPVTFASLLKVLHIAAEADKFSMSYEEDHS